MRVTLTVLLLFTVGCGSYADEINEALVARSSTVVTDECAFQIITLEAGSQLLYLDRTPSVMSKMGISYRVSDENQQTPTCAANHALGTILVEQVEVRSLPTELDNGTTTRIIVD